MKGFWCLDSSKRSNAKRINAVDKGTQCQRNWNANTFQPPTTALLKQNYRHLFLIRHGKYVGKDSLSDACHSRDHGMSPPTGTTSQTSFTASVSNKSTSASNKMTSTLTRAPPSIVNAAAFSTPSNPETRETASRKRLAYADSKSSVKSYPSSSKLGQEVRGPTGAPRHIPATVSKEPLEGALSELGREQMKATAQRLKELRIDFNQVYVSDLLRAKESGDIIAGILAMMDAPEVDSLLNEGTFPPENIHSMNPLNAAEMEAIWSHFPAKKRFDEAFQKYARKPPMGSEDMFDVIVCHCNIIKYFVHKALGVDALGLKRFSNVWFPSHASITIISVSAHGQRFIRTLGDSGHLPLPLITVNNINADVFWNSWTATPQPDMPRIPTPITSNVHFRAEHNTAHHAMSESDFCPQLFPFEALVIGTGSGRDAGGRESRESLAYRNKGVAISSLNYSSGRAEDTIAHSTTGPPKIWNRLTFKDYRDCCNEISRFIRDRDGGFATRSDLFEWIVRGRRDALLRDCESREERREMARVVVDRLVDVDLVLVQDSTADDPILSVHPNFFEA